MMPVTQSFGPGITGAQTPIALDYMPLSKITAAITLQTTGTFLVQVTLDNIFDQDGPNYVVPAVASWFTVAFAPTNATGYITFDGPWRAIRLNVSANDTGIIFQVAQAVTPRA
jgi:hypothetical protein